MAFETVTSRGGGPPPPPPPRRRSWGAMAGVRLRRGVSFWVVGFLVGGVAGRLVLRRRRVLFIQV